MLERFDAAAEPPAYVAVGVQQRELGYLRERFDAAADPLM